MNHPQFDRNRLKIRPLADRENRQVIERDHVAPGTAPGALSDAARQTIDLAVARICEARAADRAVMLAFGAHAIKNGLGPVLAWLIEAGWVTHLATNGAGIIHDWEFAFQGQSSEDVKRYVAEGQFGIWDETGRYINLALAVGAAAELGYGESVGAMIETDGLTIPAVDELRDAINEAARAENVPSQKLVRAAAAADLLELVRTLDLPAGRMTIRHPYKQYSIQAAAYRLGVPLTGHPMIGQDIIYTHPLNRGAVVGRAAERDFLAYADSVSRLDQGGVYLSVGSAVMSPMVFEKSLSMVNNLKQQRDGTPLGGHLMVVVDLAEASWDWARDGEPPADHPAYYLRYCKTFNRMGGELRYVTADNRDFLCGLARGLGA